MTIDCPLCKGITDLGSHNEYIVCNKHMEEILASSVYVQPNGKLHFPENPKAEE